MACCHSTLTGGHDCRATRPVNDTDRGASPARRGRVWWAGFDVADAPAKGAVVVVRERLPAGRLPKTTAAVFGTVLDG